MQCCTPPETPDGAGSLLKEGRPLPKVTWNLNPFAQLPEADDYLGAFNPKSHPCLSTPVDKMVTLRVQQKLFSLTGQSMDIRDTEGNVVAKLGGKFMSLRDRAVLSDAKGNPVCCVIEKVFAMSPAYYVYSFKPYFAGQKPSGEKQDGKDLYAWAKCWKKMMSFTDVFEICMAIGDNEYQAPGEGTYRAKAPSVLSPKLIVAKDHQACALLDRDVLSLSEMLDWNGWTLTCAPGTDIFLFIALVSVKDAIKDKK